MTSIRTGIKKVGKTPVLPIKFRGGMNTVREKALVDTGGFSDITNMRSRHPGFEKRKGVTALHTVADGTNKVLSLFQFSKGSQTERHTFAQMGDSDVLKATNEPPTVTTGVFGAEVFSGTTGDIPAHWSVIRDIMIYSNGSDQHKLWSGEASPVSKFIVYKDTSAIPTHPDHGEDYTIEVTDGDSTTVAILDSLGTLAQYDAIYVRTPLKANTLTFTVTKANGSAAVMQGHYWNGAWTSLASFTDNTITSSKSLAKSGTMTWTAPTDIIPHYQFGENGWWLRLSLSSGSLDSEVEVSKVTYEAPWQDVVNMWDGISLDALEVQLYDYDASAPVYKTFAAVSINLSAVTASDKVYFSSNDPIIGFYIDVGNKPNTTASTTINAVYRWDGDSFDAVSGLSDGTNGLSKSGWVTFTKPTNVQTQQFQDTKYKAYWYYFTVDQTMSSDISINLQTMPLFDINEYGRVGRCNVVWKDRAVYTFAKSPQYMYVSWSGDPTIINGDDSTLLKAGDGRSNEITCMKKFYNELMVWQAEKGSSGGCLTLFQGETPEKFGKFIISTDVGTFSVKSAVVVNGVVTSTATDEKIVTAAYFISKQGVFMSDGKTVWSISDDIQNYFDPNDSNSLRHGYNNEHFIFYDSAENILRIGLVTGSSATAPNTYLVYDIIDRKWSHDTLGQHLSCMTEVEAASGDVPILQLGGGDNDGLVYRLNNGSNDVSVAIDGFVTLEMDAGGLELWLKEIMLRVKVQDFGNVVITPYLNSVPMVDIESSMTKISNVLETIRRHRMRTSIQGYHIGLRFRNNVVSQSLYLLDAGLDMEYYEER